MLASSYAFGHRSGNTSVLVFEAEDPLCSASSAGLKLVRPLIKQKLRRGLTAFGMLWSVSMLLTMGKVWKPVKYRFIGLIAAFDRLQIYA